VTESIGCQLVQVASTHADNPAREGSKTPDGQHSSSFLEDINATLRTIAWQHLKLLGTEAGETPNEGIVKFAAYFKVVNQKGQKQKGNVMQCLQETSTFRRESETNAWKYLGGVTDVFVERGSQLYQ